MSEVTSKQEPEIWLESEDWNLFEESQRVHELFK